MLKLFIGLIIVGGVIIYKVVQNLSEQQEYEEMEKTIEDAQKQREIEAKKKEQQEIQKTNAYNEISDIWKYGDKTMLATSLLDAGGYSIHYIKLSYTPKDSSEKPWTISLKSPYGNVRKFKAKRSGNSLVCFDRDDIVAMKDSKLKVGDRTFCFDHEEEGVKYVNSLMMRLITGEKIETFRLKHLEELRELKGEIGEDVLNVLPRFTFTISEKGIKCDEINFPQRLLDDFFEKNNGGEHIFQNRVYYEEYCKNGDLEIFEPGEEQDFAYYMKEMKMFAKRLGCIDCNTKFSIGDWYAAVIHGINDLYQSIRTYVANKTLDLTPTLVSDNDIVFEYRKYSHLYSDKDNSNLIKQIAISMMEIERMENNVLYLVSLKDNDIVIKIGEEAFVSTSIIEKIK
ncbi:MAG: hypothetical protein IKV14_03790 [Muribaculaceae bacterium]|nr:hypothetical protein [Muribaculaceae bacterium]